MSQSLLSPTIITREALRVLHANLNFIGSINRQYDSQFANSGASPSGKIGPTLSIRLPNQCTVRSGAAMQQQDISEESTSLTVSTQKGVDFTFPSTDLTLTIDDFSKRYLVPFMARLASEIEADALNMYKDVAQLIDVDGYAPQFKHILQAGQLLDESLAPDDGNRVALLCPTHNTYLVDGLKGTFNPQTQISEQFKKGKMGQDTAGFNDWYRNTLLPRHVTGTAVKTTTYQVDTGSSGANLVVKTGSTTFKQGDVITIASCNAVHPETKADLGYLKQFVVTADYAGGAGTMTISPAIVTSGAKQNVSAAPAVNDAIVKVGAAASETMVQSLLYHKDAFTFVTADLVDVSKFGAWGAREVMDGISMRIARQYDITNDKIPCRIDVLYGYKAIRPQLAVRLHADGTTTS